MITESGVISDGGKVVGQLQITEDDDGNRKVCLYNHRGVYLCECPFDGDDDKGMEVGMGLYRGYVSGWDNCEFSISKSVSRALNEKYQTQIG